MQRIAYFGPAGTFTEMALGGLEDRGCFSGSVERVAAASQDAALQLVREGSVDGAVVPIESSVEGSIPATLDSLAVGSALQIVAEIELDVSFAVVARTSLPLEAVKSVRAYPIAAAQVRQWLAANVPDAQLEYASSNSAAAEDIAAGLADVAISTALAAERLGLVVIADHVADSAEAKTRFVLVRADAPPSAPSGADRTALVLGLPNEPGALCSALREFADRDVDLSRIESRPTRISRWSYFFFIDCVGHISDPAVAEAVEAARKIGDVRLLGSWPVAAGG